MAEDGTLLRCARGPGASQEEYGIDGAMRTWAELVGARVAGGGRGVTSACVARAHHGPARRVRTSPRRRSSSPRPSGGKAGWIRRSPSATTLPRCCGPVWVVAGPRPRRAGPAARTGPGGWPLPAARGINWRGGLGCGRGWAHRPLPGARRCFPATGVAAGVPRPGDHVARDAGGGRARARTPRCARPRPRTSACRRSATSPSASTWAASPERNCSA